jgi:hypothetical protein
MRLSRRSSIRKVSVSAVTPIVRKLPTKKENLLTEQASLIRLRPKQALDGFAILLNKGQVQALPDDSYVVGPEHIALLDAAGIQYDVIAE